MKIALLDKWIQTATVGFSPLVMILMVTFVIATNHNAQAAISWTGNGANAGGVWWFDPANWSQNANGLIPPSQSQNINGTAYVVTIDGQINPAATVDFDPANDPFYSSAAARQYGPGAVTGPQAGAPTAFGPNAIWRMYLTRRDSTTGVNTNTNVLNIKSGSLWVINGDAALNTNNPPYPNLGTASFIVGRSGGGTGKVVQTGGFFSMAESIDLGASEAASTGPPALPASSATGIYDYRGGTVEAGLNTTGTGRGIRLSAGVAQAPSGAGTFIDRNQSTTGHIRVQDFVVAQSNVGTTTAVGTVEFHYVPAGGGVRPIQVNRNLSINNSSTQSSRLSLVLDAAPTVDGNGVPVSLGLFDVDADGNSVGAINNTTGGDSTQRYFYSADGSTAYTAGGTVSSIFGLTRYNWTIRYTGNITWSDIDNSVVSNIDSANGRDVVLVGLSSVSALLRGDFNFDGVVNLHDVQPMLSALTDLNSYKSMHSIPSDDLLKQVADVNQDGAITNADIQALLDMAASGSGSLAAVPEPSTWVLLGTSALGLAALHNRRRGAGHIG